MLKDIIQKRTRATVLGVALAVGIGGAAFASAEHFGSHAALDLKMAAPEQSHTRLGFAPVVKRVLPSVVNISSSKVTKMPTGFEQGEMPDDPIFRQFFGRNNPFGGPRGQMPEQREKALGSGVILTPDGYIMTNNHVIDGATDVRVTLGDKREFKAKIIGADPKTDIAILKIDASNLPAITIGDSSKVEVGDYALAIGNPFGVGQTVTMGIVSAMGRNHLGIEDYEDFIQTDAPINPGNSGGALVNDRGDLIGINTAILAHGSEGNQGIGFAIPVNMARNVMDQIVRNGKVTRAYLGIVPQDVTPAIARAFNVKDYRGALVGDVTAGSPADRAGLQKGDIILEVNGTTVEGANDLRNRISMMTPDSNVALKVARSGGDRTLNVKLGELPGTEAKVEHQDGKSSSVLSGVSVENLDAQTAKELGMNANALGVVVTNVRGSSAAAEAGLQRGDVIQEVNRKPVRNTSDFDRAVAGSKDETLLLVNRHGNTLFIAV